MTTTTTTTASSYFGGAIARCYPDVIPASDAMLTFTARVPQQLAALAYKADAPVARWIKRCKCGEVVRFEGRNAYIASSRGIVREAMISTDGTRIAIARVMGAHDLAIVACKCGRGLVLRRVFDGGKHDSKRHECGARCRNAVGPSCDCKCRGEFHGAG